MQWGGGEGKPTVCSMHLRKRNEKVSSFIYLEGKKEKKKKNIFATNKHVHGDQ